MRLRPSRVGVAAMTGGPPHPQVATWLQATRYSTQHEILTTLSAKAHRRYLADGPIAVRFCMRPEVPSAGVAMPTGSPPHPQALMWPRAIR